MCCTLSESAMLRKIRENKLWIAGFYFGDSLKSAPYFAGAIMLDADQLRCVFCLLLSYPLAFLSLRISSSTQRHLYFTLWGILYCQLIFGIWGKFVGSFLKYRRVHPCLHCIFHIVRLNGAAVESCWAQAVDFHTRVRGRLCTPLVLSCISAILFGKWKESYWHHWPNDGDYN